MAVNALCLLLLSIFSQRIFGSDNDDDACRHSFKDYGTSFDLSRLKADSRYYNVKHKFVTFENYSYAFNICGNTNEIPGAGANGRGDACLNTTESGSSDDTKKDYMGKPAPAYQVAMVDNECHRLGSDYKNVEWSLLETEDPSRGVAYTYKDGNQCNQQDKNRRSLKISLLCADDVLNIPDEEVIKENKKCEYEIEIQSLSGCPTECGVKNYNLCNKKGVCRYDRSQLASRCFCDEGYEGDDCGTVTTTTGSGSDKATLGVLIFVSILLVCVITGIAVVWIKIRGLRLDPQAYATLSGGGRQAQEEL